MTRTERTLYNALVSCAKELERLHFVHTPHFTGKIGEPDVKVIKRAKRVIDKVAA